MANQKSLLEVALEIMNEKSAEINVYELIDEVLKRQELTDEDGTLSAKLYSDIVISAAFVFLGDDVVDLKKNKTFKELEDLENSSYISSKDDDEDLDEENDDDADETSDESLDSDDIDESNELDDEDLDEEDQEEYDEEYDDELDDSYDDNSLDDEKYNKYMDDYEKLYED